MTNTVRIRNGHEEVKEYVNVVYCENALRTRDRVPGLAIQYKSGSTEFIAHGEILGIYPYPDEEDREFTDKYEELVN